MEYGVKVKKIKNLILVRYTDWNIGRFHLQSLN